MLREQRMKRPSDSFMMLALWMAWIFLRLTLARVLEGKARDAGGSFLGDDLQALDHAGHDFMLDAGVQALGVLANDDEIDALDSAWEPPADCEWAGSWRTARTACAARR